MIDVSFMDTNNKSLDSDGRLVRGECIHVDGQEAECIKLSNEGTANILSNLPENMREKVIRLLFVNQSIAPLRL